MTGNDETYKILLLTAEFPPQIGGIATLTSQLAEALHGRVHRGKEVKVHVVTSVGSKEENDFPVTRTPDFLNIKLLKIMPLLVATIWVCLREKPDKLLLGKWTHEAFVAFFVARVLGVPYVTFVHGSEVLKYSKRRFFRSLLRGLLGAGEKVIAVSNYTKSLVVDLGLPPEKVPVVSNALRADSYDTGVSVEDLVERHGLEGKTVILTVSRLVERKGHDRVLDVLPGVIELHPDVIYLIAGDGDYRRVLEKKVDRLGLGHNVKFLGFVKGDTLDKLYAASDVFVMPNRVDGETEDVEGFGISFLEANLFGLPVIGGKSGGAVDAIADGETGFLVDPNDPGEIEKRLTKLIEDEKLRDQMGKRGRERVLERFGVDRQTEEVLEVLWE